MHGAILPILKDVNKQLISFRRVNNKILLTPNFLIAGLALLLVAGCGKKDSETPVAQPVVKSQSAAPTIPNAPTAPTPSAIPDTRLAESQAALKANDYEKAANTLLSLQQTQLSEQQAAAMTAQMKQLQSSLVNALASGDPRAKAAAARLRQTPR